MGAVYTQLSLRERRRIEDWWHAKVPVLAMASRLNLQVGTVEIDEQGVIPDAFETWCTQARPKAFCLTPTLQAPTTVTLSNTRRAEIAERYGVILIEDDVFGLLKPDRPPPITLSAPDNTIYVTSLSKTVAPGLRVGFLHAPKRMARRCVQGGVRP